MTGIIDVGGGLRGIYGAGVLDVCMEEQLNFDVCIGVSAGSANMAAFLGLQRGRNYKFYTEYAKRPEYMGAKEFARNGSYINLDYVYGTLSNEDGDAPLDYDAVMQNPAALIAVATDAQTGEAVYFTKQDIERNRYRIFNASCAIPVACKPQEVREKLYYDGGVSDPVPVKKAVEAGCGKLVLILTKPLSFDGESKADAVCAKLLRKENPAIAAQLLLRGKRYRDGVALARQLQADGKCLILAPDDTCGVKTVTRDQQKLDLLYKKGRADAAKIKPFLERI